MEKHLLHTDHSLLHYLNQQAIAKGVDQPFEYVETPTTNNGEVFLLEYFTAQVRRNYETLEDSQQPGMKTWQCAECTLEDTAMVAVELSVNEVKEQEEQPCEIDVGNRKNDDDDDDNPLPALIHLPAPSTAPAAANQQPDHQQQTFVPPGNEKLMCFPLPPFQCSAFRRYVLRKMQARNYGDSSVPGLRTNFGVQNPAQLVRICRAVYERYILHKISTRKLLSCDVVDGVPIYTNNHRRFTFLLCSTWEYVLLPALKHSSHVIL
jgi:hypothetical protein